MDFSSAFNTIIPTRLPGKLMMGLNTALCAWILDFLTVRPQDVRVGRHTSRPFTLNTGSPQACIFSPLLYSLYTHDCVVRFSSDTIVKFADDTVVVGLISGNDEKTYREEVSNLLSRCQDNSLMLNVSKTKELIVDFRRTQQYQRTYTPLGINGTAVEMVRSFRYLAVTEDLTCSATTTSGS